VCITRPGKFTVAMVGTRSVNSMTLGSATGSQTLEIDGSCVEGAATLDTATNSTIRRGGTIDLADTTGGSCVDKGAAVNQLAGTLSNAGTIHAVAGTTDRVVQANITNTGTISVDDATQLSDEGGTLSNRAGTIAATGTGRLYLDGVVVYNQGGGTTSGTSTTPVVVENGTLSYTGTGASTVIENGFGHITGTISPGQTLALQATCDDNAFLVADASWTNAGTVDLADSSDGACDARVPDLYEPGTTLTNTGTIHAAPGFLGRYIEGRLLNRGKLIVDAGVTLISSEGGITNTATATVATAIASASASSYGQIDGPIKLGGSLVIASSYTPLLGATFPIISCDTCEKGKFATVAGQSITGGLAYGVTSKATGTTLAVKRAADLSVTGSAPSPVVDATNFVYTFTVDNAGPDTAPHSKLVDTLPSNVLFFSGSASCSAVGATITCATGNLASGASTTVKITVTAGVAGGFGNVATASTVDITPADATSKVFVTIT
jgi:uncharacterized repeat protein (TIGR01451 family)